VSGVAGAGQRRSRRRGGPPAAVRHRESDVERLAVDLASGNAESRKGNAHRCVPSNARTARAWHLQSSRVRARLRSTPGVTGRARMHRVAIADSRAALRR